MKKYLIILLAALPFAASAQIFSGNKAKTDDPSLQLRKFSQVYSLLNAFYIDEVDNPKLIESAIKEMLAELDPHSTYISPEEMVGTRESFAGKFAGIGVQIAMLRDTMIVTGVIPGGPSEKVGLRPNDRIVSVDGGSVIGLKQTEIVKQLRGAKGSKVDVGIARNGSAGILNFNITRGDIPIHTVDAAYMIDGETGYIKVNRFANTTMKEMRAAYNKFGSPQALILDLRGNGGGYLDQALDMANFFLPKGSLLLSTEGRKTTNEDKYKAGKTGEYLHGKVVVLIDELSASASEIVAGALQDWDRAVIVGRRSFGKGLVQRQYNLLDGAAVNITVSRYLTPTGRAIQRPFTKGDQDSYYKDLANRIKSDNDTLNTPDSLRYTTLRLGKEVYGGGGIYPDYYVHADTSSYSAYLSALLRGGIIAEFAMSYLDRHRSELESMYPDFAAFRDMFEVTPEMIGQLTQLAEKSNIPLNESELAISKSNIERRLKFSFAQSLFGLSEAYEIYNAGDEVFAKGMEIVRNWKKMSRKIATDKI